MVSAVNSEDELFDKLRRSPFKTVSDELDRAGFQFIKENGNRLLSIAAVQDTLPDWSIIRAQILKDHNWTDEDFMVEELK